MVHCSSAIGTHIKYGLDSFSQLGTHSADIRLQCIHSQSYKCWQAWGKCCSAGGRRGHALITAQVKYTPAIPLKIHSNIKMYQSFMLLKINEAFIALYIFFTVSNPSISYMYSAVKYLQNLKNIQTWEFIQLFFVICYVPMMLQYYVAINITAVLLS